MMYGYTEGLRVGGGWVWRRAGLDVLPKKNIVEDLFLCIVPISSILGFSPEASVAFSMRLFLKASLRSFISHEACLLLGRMVRRY